MEERVRPFGTERVASRPEASPVALKSHYTCPKTLALQGFALPCGGVCDPMTLSHRLPCPMSEYAFV